jgi:hypothetical protein
MNSEILFEIFIFLIAACLVVPLANRFKLSSIIGYLFAGLLIGPSCFGLIANSEGAMHFAEFSIIMMLFLPQLEWRSISTGKAVWSSPCHLLSFAFFDDKPALMNFAKTRRVELEQILQSDSPLTQETTK